MEDVMAHRDAAAAQAQITVLEDRGVLTVSGPDRRSFLQGLVSNDVEKTAADRAVYAALLTAQGKYLHDFFMVEVGEAIWLDAEAARLADLKRRLSMYRLRAKVEIAERPELAVAALRRDGFLMLYPGSVREAGMRSYRDEPYRLKWEGRSGFLRLALDAEADVVFVAALGNDEAYYQSALPMPGVLTRLVNAGDADRYPGMRLAFGLLGPHLVPGLFPLPVRLTHVIAKPLDLGDRERARRDPQALEALHARVWSECQQFLDRVVADRKRHSDTVDRSIRGAQALLQRFGL